MGLVVREARKSELDDVTEMNMELTDVILKHNDYYKPSSDIRDIFSSYMEDKFSEENYRILVALVDEKIVGTMRGAIETSAPQMRPDKVGLVSGAFVRKGFRRMGVARKMLDELILWFKGNDVYVVELAYEPGNPDAKKCWAACGFKQFRMIVRKDI